MFFILISCSCALFQGAGACVCLLSFILTVFYFSLSWHKEKITKERSRQTRSLRAFCLAARTFRLLSINSGSYDASPFFDCLGLRSSLKVGVVRMIKFNVHIFRTGLIKKALRKFEWLALRNEIDVTNAWLCSLFVGRIEAWIYSKDGANFILSAAADWFFLLLLCIKTKK